MGGSSGGGSGSGGGGDSYGASGRFMTTVVVEVF